PARVRHPFPTRRSSDLLPKRFAQAFNELYGWRGPLQSYKNSDIEQIADTLGQWTVKPAGTEGYRTAEVTLGGVDTRQLSSKTMRSEEHTSELQSRFDLV